MILRQIKQMTSCILLEIKKKIKSISQQCLNILCSCLTFCLNCFVIINYVANYKYTISDEHCSYTIIYYTDLKRNYQYLRIIR